MKTKIRHANKVKKPKYSREISDALAAAGQDGKDIELSTYEITYGPIQREKLPREINSQLEEIHDLVASDPKQAIARLQALKDKYPNAPVLYNYLSAAYSRIGDNKASMDLAQENYRANPDYLFAKVNYAQMCLYKGDAARIPEIFGEKYDLKQLYPHRNRFHATEFTAFTGVMCAYFAAIGRRETAERLYKALEQVDPLSDMLLFANRFLYPSPLARLKNWIINLFRRAENREGKAKP